MSDKILFLLTNDYTHYCLAYSLQKIYDCKMYAISEVTSRPKKFFQSQNLVNFENMWFFHDQIKKKSTKPDLDYLEKLEKKYKINLWKLVQNERIFLYFKNFYKFTSDEVLNILEQECRFFEKILEDIKPDYFFTRLPSLHHQELIYQMCRNTGIKTLAMNYTLLAKKCMISEGTKKLDYDKEFDSIKYQDRSFDEIQKYLQSFDLIKQLEEKLVKPGSSKLEKLESMGEYLLNFDSVNTETHYTYYGRTKRKVFFYYLNDYLKTKMRKSFIDKNLKLNSQFNDPFVYFPLHMEMERTTLIGAPYYVNQIEIIKNIAKSLPINFKLFIKEHPGQVNRGWRNKSEYKEIMDIPNVVLFHPDFSKDTLYKNCSIVFSIAGTASFEAACFGKPAITLVDLNYSILPSVHTLKNFDGLHDLINQLLIEKVDSKDVNRFLALFEKNVSNFDWSDFTKKLSDEFFSGKIQDIEISEEKMKLFLEKNFSTLELFANDHIKKIQWFKSLSVH